MKKVLWAVDAFQDDKGLDRNAIQILKVLAEKTGCKVEPSYVLSPDQLSLSVEFTAPWVEEWKPAAERALKKNLEKVEIPGLMKPSVLVQRVPSLSRAVKSLGAHAMAGGADMIAIGTHARKGLPRLFLGSFTESLLLTSKVPVLVFGPSTRTVKKLDRIIFATDFSKKSLSAFKKVVDLAKDLGASITIFHHVQNPIEPILQSGVYMLGGGWVSTAAYLKEETRTQKVQAEKMAQRAKDAGVKTEVLVDSGPLGITDSLLRAAERNKASMIAIAAQSGPVAATLIGSIARQVVRSALCPVWVIRPAS